MTFLLGSEKVSVEYPSKRVLHDVSLGINTGDRIGVVGRNGDGKSTLLRLFAKEIDPHEGRIIYAGNLQVGILEQQDALIDEQTVGYSIVGDVPEHEWAGNARVRSVISGLVSDISWEATIGTLSGGQRRRVDLARLLVGDHDVLLLDEPTNHLDIKAIDWLVQHLKKRWRDGQGAFLVVTHDRWFLDEVCTTMWEVHDGTIEPFEGGFSAYIMQRVERERIARVTEERRQNKLRRELAWLSRGARARSTKPKFHVKAAQELIADVPPLRNDLELKRMAMTRLGKQVVDLKNISMDFDGQRVLDSIEWSIGPGDRIGIIGENGAGKTTLIKVLQQKLQPTLGYVKVGKTVKFAFLSQHLEELQDVQDDRVRQAIGRFGHVIMLDGKDQTPKQLLERLGFTNADMNEPIKDLSGGQKRRLALMLILLEEPNVLILDEPGNDLDVDMLAAVEDLLDGWPGTLLLITHDRYLLERVTDDQYALMHGRLRHLPGGVDEYLCLSSTDSSQGVSKELRHKDASASCDKDDSPAEKGFSQKELRALKKQLQSLDRKMDTLKGKIEEGQQRLLEVEPSDFQALGAIQADIDTYRYQLEEFEELWIETAEKLEE